jgi:4-hydroxybenzoate polyprenyltransferase/phosphoserine phosphatase
LPLDVSPSTLETAVKTPLVVDLDGTLLRSDLLVESFFASLESSLTSALSSLASIADKAELKKSLAQTADIDLTNLPFDSDVLAHIESARAQGRSVYLASASNEKFVGAIASHLGLFDGWLASDHVNNLSGARKAKRLVEMFGPRGFSYIGNSTDDLEVWRVADEKLAVRPTQVLRSKLMALDADAKVIDTKHATWRDWTKLVRVHQWAKNALVVVPLLTSHQFDLPSLFSIAAAFLAFSFGASAVYILNDLVDLGSDRRHLTKRNRPLAAGTVPILAAVSLVPLLVALSLLIAALTSRDLLLTLVGYLIVTTAYSFSLKRKMLIDVVVLAALYTARIIAGAAAIGVSVSEWLLAFSMFFFTSLALIKRYIELSRSRDNDRAGAAGRNYLVTDLEVISGLAAAAGFNAVTVFALYVSSSAVHKLYSHPERLWLICPVLMYWIARALLMAHRRWMDDDPVIFALKDRNSYMAAAIIMCIAIAATL